MIKYDQMLVKNNNHFHYCSTNLLVTTIVQKTNLLLLYISLLNNKPFPLLVTCYIFPLLLTTVVQKTNLLTNTVKIAAHGSPSRALSCEHYQQARCAMINAYRFLSNMAVTMINAYKDSYQTWLAMLCLVTINWLTVTNTHQSTSHQPSFTIIGHIIPCFFYHNPYPPSPTIINHSTSYACWWFQ